MVQDFFVGADAIGLLSEVGNEVEYVDLFHVLPIMGPDCFYTVVSGAGFRLRAAEYDFLLTFW